MLLNLEVDSPTAVSYLNEVAELFDNPSIREEVERLLDFIPGVDDETNVKDAVLTCLTAVYDEVENLFDMLAAIGSLRHICCSREPRRATRTTTTPSTVMVNGKELSSDPAESPLPLIEENIRLAETIAASLKQKDKEDLERKEKSTAATMAALFEEENKRLREWKALSKKSNDEITVDMAAILENLKLSLTGNHPSPSVPQLD